MVFPIKVNTLNVTFLFEFVYYTYYIIGHHIY